MAEKIIYSVDRTCINCAFGDGFDESEIFYNCPFTGRKVIHGYYCKSFSIHPDVLIQLPPNAEIVVNQLRV